MKSIVITCEHSSNEIPGSHRHLFADSGNILDTHRGWDFGAKQIANFLGKKFRTTVHHGRYSRLLIDLNRSQGHQDLFSAWTRGLDTREKEFLFETYHRPHWDRVHKEVQKKVQGKNGVLHIGVHSFTPVYDGKTRSTDIGLLYDPTRPAEHNLALRWQKELKKSSDYTVHRNRPYRGVGDGLISSFRREFSNRKYRGIELEVNHRLMTNKKEITKIIRLLTQTLQTALQEPEIKKAK